jgi:hypothetical protein
MRKIKPFKIEARMHPVRTIITICLLIVLFQGCAGNVPHQEHSVPVGVAEYQSFYTALDDVVRRYDVGEASVYPVHGFPYLRTNRFLAAMKDRISDDEGTKLWIEEMLQRDIAARKKEISNLPDQAIEELAGTVGALSSREDLLSALEVFAGRLLMYDRHQPDFIETVKAGVDIAGEYSTAMRTFGLYPVAYYPVLWATEDQYEVFREWHRNPLEELKADGSITVFVPPPNGVLSEKALSALFGAAGKDAFGRPNLTTTQLKQLIVTYAPVIHQDVAADYDFFGEVRWQDDQVTIDHRNHTVYYYITYGFIKGEPALQLNYSFWYSGRWGRNAPRIEHGPLDGITIRITLDSQGLPVIMDVMNNCGCYYFSAPHKDKIDSIVPSSSGLYPFVPTWLPESYPDRRMHIRINSGWHQIQHIFTRDVPSDAFTYQLVPYDVLEALPKDNLTTESVFTSDGIMKDSSRIEPYIFFSMGIPKVGYMRQRGHHAIKLIGRAHFTDPDVFDKYFIFN